MSDNRFDSIAHAILEQKQMMDALVNENRELRRQIADLRAGHGVFIEVAGQRFPLKGEITVAQPVRTPNVQQQDFLPVPGTSSLPNMPVAQVQGNEYQESAQAAPTPEYSSLADTFAVKEKEKVPTFLEEIMLDEFVAASTSPMTASKGAGARQEEPIDEEQKAALRRELMGSFLLE
jgi:hypothetical protein